MEKLFISSAPCSETAPKKMRSSNGAVWKSVALLLVVVMTLCDAQTFQYSRGWTNGKRSRGTEARFPVGQGPNQPFDIDVGVMEVPVEDAAVPLRINLSPQLRPRSSDYSQESRTGSFYHTQAAAGLGWNSRGARTGKQL